MCEGVAKFYNVRTPQAIPKRSPYMASVDANHPIRTRSLRFAVLAGLAVTVIAWSLVEFGVARTLLVDSYLAQEHADGIAHAERIANMVNVELRRLDRTAKDWSLWDDTYDFILGANDEFIGKNIYHDVFTNLKLDLMAFIAADGSPRLVKSVDAETGESRAIPPDVASLLGPSGAWLQAHRENRARLGLVRTQQGLLAFAAQPIHRSKPTDPGPSVGTQIFARYLGPAFITELRETLRMDIALFDLQTPTLPPDVKSAADLVGPTRREFVAPIDGSNLGSYALLEDSAGTPIAILRAITWRSGYAHARQVEFSLLIASLIIGGIAGLVVYWFIERRILRRLIALDRAVLDLADGGDPARRVPELPFADEVARLGRSVNAMLAEIESQQDAREARDAAVMASRLKSEFLATMSHEIRTPLNGVLGMLELALEDELPGRQRERIATAYRSATGLLALLNDILDFSRFNAGALVLEEADFDLRQLVEDTTVLFAPRAEQHRLGLNCYIAPTLAGRYRGDHHRLRQVLANLVNNAIKFTPRGEIIVRAELVESGSDGDGIEFKVVDTGIGMTPTQLANLFKPFSQGDASTARRYGGTGLGLSICKQIVTQMGGVIDADSSVTVGTSMRATVRLKRSDREASAAPPAQPGRGLHALVLGPADGCRSTVMDYLRALGTEVTLISDLTAVTDLDAEKRIDFTIVDETLPISRERWLTPALQAIPAICLCALGTPPEPSWTNGLKLAKPVHWHQLRHAVEAMGKLPERLDYRRAQALPIGLDLSGRRVLLVEDIELNRRVTHQLLDVYRVSVDDAESGELALELLENGQYDLVFMDWRLTNLDGIETTRRWREREGQLGRQRVPIVALTAHALVVDETCCRKAGMDDYLTKPLTRDALTRVLMRWLSSNLPGHSLRM